MCTIPPAPPPPPPPVLSDLCSSKIPSKTDNQVPVHNRSDICKWASGHPELWDSCSRNKLCLQEPPFRYKYRHFDSIIQVGPTCGLVALSMLVDGEVAADEILNITKSQGFSHNGEMFSCKNMAKIAEKVFSLAELDNITFSVKNGGLFSKETIDKLLDGAVLLVPYPFEVFFMLLANTNNFKIVILLDAILKFSFVSSFLPFNHKINRFYFKFSLISLHNIRNKKSPIDTYNLEESK